MIQYEEILRIGIIQTNVDDRTAWSKYGKLTLRMQPYAEKMVMDEIRKGFKDLMDRKNPPKIVLIPEYSIPEGGIPQLEKHSKSMSAVIIGGLDVIEDSGNVYNKGIVIVPDRWPEKTVSYSTSHFFFGKTYFSEVELDWFKKCGHKTPISDSVNYIIDANIYGNIGIAICSDFYDIERFVIYKGKIHHLLIISYNKDYKSFEFLAEAISRLLLCNVVICNTGNYGDSLAYSPYRKEYKRIIYKNAGANLFSTQIIELPTNELEDNQIAAHDKFTEGKDVNSKDYRFKWPPGYKKFDRY